MKAKFYGKQDYSHEGQRRKAQSIKKLIEERVKRDTKSQKTDKKPKILHTIVKKIIDWRCK